MKRPYLWAAVILAAGCAAGIFAWTSVDVREIGRTDPKRAANHRLPWNNFDETYLEGSALGLEVGSSKIDAIKAAETGGFVVQPSCWNDSRAGGAELYERSDLLAVMLRQATLCFNDKRDLKKGMIVHFQGERLASIEVYYINSEAF